ncbi:hypothetical protein RRF57_012178 [Xylaria bambusicola]|uniref:Uncharacterized protein n=1 Tax=Xylaria bambusicola TaxID=326684 RepID=A0AAN7V1G0_9PEZI
MVDPNVGAVLETSQRCISPRYVEPDVQQGALCGMVALTSAVKPSPFSAVTSKEIMLRKIRFFCFLK